MQNAIEMVKEFRRVTRLAQGKVPDPETPTIPNFDARYVAAKVLLEEVVETIRAMGLEIGCEVTVTYPNDSQFGLATPSKRVTNLAIYVEKEDHHPASIVEVADGVADTMYTAIGVAVAFGFDPEPILNEVCENNALKLVNPVFIDGKLQKPANHPRPRIKALLASTHFICICGRKCQSKDAVTCKCGVYGCTQCMKGRAVRRLPGDIARKYGRSRKRRAGVRGH